MYQTLAALLVNLVQIRLLLINQCGQPLYVPLLGKLKPSHTLVHELISIIIERMLYALVQYGLLTIVCTYLVHHYASKEVSLHVKIWSIFTWVLNFGLALLVP
jgi:hypothetical protein